MRNAQVGPGSVLDGTYHRAARAVAVDRFAWSARPMLGAEVLMHDADEGQLIEAMAQFLWGQRNRLPELD